jgi:acid phosphatase family membrane protein YuiD
MAGNEIEVVIRGRNTSGPAIKEARGDADKMAASTKRAGAESSRSFDEAGRHAGGFGASLRRVGEIATGFLAANVISKIPGLFRGVMDEAREAQLATAQTNAVLKSTGGIANVSAAQIGTLATAISNKVGVDDEAIQSGENLLLTFTGIRNETGKGNDIFNRATTAITDLAAGMNKGEVSSEGLKASAIQVGKALNDPIKGVTALQKIGVTFTAGQKAQIKSLVEHGHALQAQKIILGELNKEFGGSAAAGATAGKRLGVVMGNIKESIGTALLPVVDKLANWLSDKLPGALAFASTAFGKLEDGVKAMGAAFSGEGVTDDGFVGVMERIGVAARVVFDYFQTTVLPVLRSFGAFIMNTVVPALAAFIGWLVRNRDLVIPIVVGILAMVAAYKVWMIVSRAMAVAQALLNAVMAANPIGLVIIALIGIVAAFATAWKTSERFRNVVTGVFHAVTGAVSATWNWIKGHWPLLLAILTGPFGLAVLWITRHWDGVVNFFKGIPARMAGIGAGMWSWIKESFRAAVNAIIDWWDGLEFKAPTVHIPGTNVNVGGFVIGLPDIPHIAKGGVVRSRPGGTLALLGEGGRDEAVIPLGAGGPLGGGRVVLELHSSGSRVDDLLVEILRQAIRIRGGGDVQLVLGRS